MADRRFQKNIAKKDSTVMLLKILISLLALILALTGCSVNTATENSEINTKTAEETYSAAYENTAALESYSMKAEIFLRKLVFDAKVSGIIKKQDGAYTGSAVLKFPGKKYSYTYSSPYDGKDNCTVLSSEDGDKYLSFNIASIGTGVIRPLTDEITETGEFTNKAKTEIEFSITNEQAEALYGEIIDFFKTAAADYIDLSDMFFTSGTIDVSIENERITDYTVTLKADSRIGKLTCGLSCTVM